MNPPTAHFSAIILAADRGPADPVARAAGTPCKALTPVAGRAMVLRVVDALMESSLVDRIMVSGSRESLLEQDPELVRLVETERIHWVENAPSPSQSVLASLRSLPDEEPVLVTTADHALLNRVMVDHFCTEAALSNYDVVAGLAPYSLVARAFPESRRTVTKLSDGGVCGCNLFAFLTPRARRAAEFWRRVEQQRKNPLKVVKAVGWIAVLRYLMGRLTLAEGLARLSRAMGVEAGAVLMPFAEAAVDVDKVEDWELAESVLSNRK